VGSEEGRGRGPARTLAAPWRSPALRRLCVAGSGEVGGEEELARPGQPRALAARWRSPAVRRLCLGEWEGGRRGGIGQARPGSGARRAVAISPRFGGCVLQGVGRWEARRNGQARPDSDARRAVAIASGSASRDRTRRRSRSRSRTRSRTRTRSRSRSRSRTRTRTRTGGAGADSGRGHGGDLRHSTTGSPDAVLVPTRIPPRLLPPCSLPFERER